MIDNHQKYNTLIDLSNDNLIYNLINEIMMQIKNKELIYQNEEQFQFDLAWRINKRIEEDSGIEVLLEYFSMTDKTIKNNKNKLKKFFTDILILDSNGNYIPIELKYKKMGMQSNIKKYEKPISIGHDGAVDLGKFDFLWDIHRIEQLKDNDKSNIEKDKLLKNFVCGYAIMITNDDGYWNVKKGSCTDSMTLNKKIDCIRWCVPQGKATEANSITNKDGKNYSKYFATLKPDYEYNSNFLIEKRSLPLNNGNGYDFSLESGNVISFNGYKCNKFISNQKGYDNKETEIEFRAFVCKI